MPDSVEIALGLNEEAANGDCQGANDAIEYGFANLPDDPMSLTANCADARVTAARNAAAQTVTVTLGNPVGPMALPAGTEVTVVFAHFGAFSAVPASSNNHCVAEPSILVHSVFKCTLSNALPSGNGQHVDFEFVVGSQYVPGGHSASLTPIQGFTDPAPANNTVAF